MAKKKFKTLAILVFFFTFAKASHPVTSAKELLNSSSAHFDKGQYKKALELIAFIDIRSDFDSSDDMKLAFKIRAIAYEQTGDIKRASETIRELFFIDPSYKFDPFDTPKTVVALAHKEKMAIDEKNQHLASAKNEAQLELGLTKRATVEKEPLPERTNLFIEKRPHMVTTLFPLGLNHFYLSSPTRGGIYLSLQSLSLATNIAAFWWKQSYLDGFGTHRLKDKSLQGRFETAQLIQYIALGAMIVTYGTSVVDAVIRFLNTPSQKVGSGEITS